MATRAADVRDFVAQQAADARVSAAVQGRRQRDLAENPAEFIAQQAAAATRRRRSQSGRRPPPEPPDLPSVAETAERAAMAAPQPQRTAWEHADGRSRAAEHAEGRSRGPQWEEWEWEQWWTSGRGSWDQWDWHRAKRRDEEPWPAWKAVQEQEREEQIALGAAGPEAMAQQEKAHAQEQRNSRNWGASGSSSDGVGRTCTGQDNWNALTGVYYTGNPLRMSIVPKPEVIQERAQERSPAADVTPQRGAAVAAPANPRDVDERPLTMEFFEQVAITHNRRQHNAALKFLRDDAALADESERECAAVMQIGKIVKQKRDKGYANMDYYWKDGETVDWSWHEMIAHMEPETRAFVVNGEGGSSGGLVRCSVSRRPNSYAHKMCHAANEGQQPPTPAARAGEHQAEYDFLVVRADGSAVRIHPDWCQKTFPIYSENPHAAPVRAPARYGGTCGRGTYKWYKNMAKIRDGAFDAQKGSHMLPHKKGYP